MAKAKKAIENNDLLKWTGPDVCLVLPSGKKVRAWELTQEDLQGLKARENAFVR
uniref:hypothetical protein n=1 Tax=Roseivirga sp. TaxID=1964215 RepID=UPI0040479DAD